MSKRKRDRFDVQAVRFLRRVRRERPTWDQVGAIVACLYEQMGDDERAEADLFVARVQDRWGVA